jgi:hypothetical protein
MSSYPLGGPSRIAELEENATNYLVARFVDKLVPSKVINNSPVLSMRLEYSAVGCAVIRSRR